MSSLTVDVDGKGFPKEEDLDSLVGTLMQQLRENPPEWMAPNAGATDDATKVAIDVFDEQRQSKKEVANFSEKTKTHWLHVGKTAEKSREWYDKAADWWSDPGKAPATVDGVLGGFGELDPIDVEESSQFLTDICALLSSTATTATTATTTSKTDIPTRALDGGAGIGRVAKHLLSRYYDKVDLVEGNQRLLDAAPAYMAGKGVATKSWSADELAEVETIEEDVSEHLGELYCDTLQSFVPKIGTYNCIWVQWVIIYLTDVDLIAFLKRCADSLCEGGFIVIKENVLGDKGEHLEYLLDEEDSSLTRSKPYMKWIFEQSNLDVFVETKQENWHRSMLPVMMYALVKKQGR